MHAPASEGTGHAEIRAGTRASRIGAGGGGRRMSRQGNRSRRGFLSGAMQAGAGLIALRRAMAAPAKRISKMRFGFTSYQWGSDWDIPTMIANLTKAKTYSTELRTSAHYAHGVELTLTAEQRRDV